MSSDTDERAAFEKWWKNQGWKEPTPFHYARLGWLARAAAEARADSAVPSSHVSDQPSALSDRAALVDRCVPPTWEQLRAIAMDTSERTGGAKNPEAYVLAGWYAAVHHEAPEPNHPKAEGESILREALARLPSLASILRAAGFHPSHGDWWSNEDIDNDDSMISAAAFDRISEAWEAARSALAGIPLNASGDPTERSG